MHFAGSGLIHHANDFYGRRSANNGIVNQHHALSSDNGAIGIVLEFDAEGTNGLGGFNEGAAHIVISDDAEFKGNSGLLGIAKRCGHAGVRDGHHNISSNGRFEGELFAQLLADLIDRAATED